jgi:hypothetical protein
MYTFRTTSLVREEKFPAVEASVAVVIVIDSVF